MNLPLKSKQKLILFFALILPLSFAAGAGAETGQAPMAISTAHRDLAKRKAAALPAGTGEFLLFSTAALVQDQENATILFEKNQDRVQPIASITKLMTALVTLDAELDLNETLSIGMADVDRLRHTGSRLAVGARLTRMELLRLALMSSDNRAAAALGRHYPHGTTAFVRAMNMRAASLGMESTHFVEPTGLSAHNVSSARDLAKLVVAAARYPLIREWTQTPEHTLRINGQPQTFRNTNLLVRDESWEIDVTKTGYIGAAGKCLVMQAWLDKKPMVIVILDAWGPMTRVGDAMRVKEWIESVARRERK